MRNKYSTAFFAFTAVSVLTTQVEAATCADPTGANGCFTTIQQAVNAATAGERVNVRPGIYHESVVIPADKDNIVLRGVGGNHAAKPVIIPDTSDDTAEGPGILVESGADGVTIRKIEIRQSDFEGILVETGALNTLIDNVHVAAVRGSCIAVSGDGARIQDSLLEACASRGLEVGLSPGNLRPVHREDECQPDPLNDCPRADNVTLIDSVIRGTGSSSVHLFGDNALIRNNDLLRAAGVGVRGSSRNTRIIGNFFRQSADQAIQIGGSDLLIRNNKFRDIGNECLELGGPNIEVRNNEFVQCEEEAMEFKGNSGEPLNDGLDLLTTNLLIIGNKMHQLGDECIEVGGVGNDDPPITNVVVRNNVIEHCEDGSMQFVDVEQLTIENNRMSFYQQDGIDARNVNDVLIKGNTFRYGQRGNSQAINFDGSNGRIINNEIEKTIGDGIEYCGINPVIKGNTIEYTNEPGIKYSCGEEILAPEDGEDSSIGLVCGEFDTSDCTGGEISDNVVRYVANEQAYEIIYNAQDGDPRLLIANNRAIEAGDDGFKIIGAEVDLIGNVARRNGDSQGREGDNGFLIVGTDILVRNNQAHDNHEDGFHVCGTNIQLEGNRATGNLEDGFDIGGDQRSGPGDECFRQLADGIDEFVVADSDDIELTNNRSNNNNAVGFEVSANADMTSVTNNRAANNRTDFCDEGTSTTTGGNNFGTTGACVID